MTNEQLDEIENRQAAAVWIGGPTAAFAQDTLLLVKALREARAEAERLRDLVRDLRGYITPTQEQFAPILTRVDVALKTE